MIKEDICRELVFWGERLEDKDIVNALEGNISIIDREDGQLYITPSAKSKALLTPEMIAVLDSDGNQIAGSLKRSSEYLLHEAVFKARPDCNAAIHSHAPYLTAYALCCKDIELKCTASFVLGYGKIPCLPYGELGTPAITEGIEEVMKDYQLVLLGNHGCICVDKDLESCARRILGAEAVMKAYFLARFAGEPKDLTEEQIDSVLAHHPFSWKKNK